MSVLIEDSPRNLLLWILRSVESGLAAGAVISPFASPAMGLKYRRSASAMSDGLTDAGAEVWFDAQTHALQMSGVGDFRYYQGYDLWAGDRGDLSSYANRDAHLKKVFDVQDQLKAPHLAPTVLLHHAETQTSAAALEMAELAVETDSDCWLTIAGTGPFWESGAALDAHIGALAQLEPAGWFLVPVRQLAALPAEIGPAEVHGLCRTTRALSENALVHVSHGDLASLPAVASGASSIGSGWDQRQRSCAYVNYAEREAGGEGGGGWYERITVRRLLGSLKAAEVELLRAQQPQLYQGLGEFPPPGPQEAFRHHLSALQALIADIESAGPGEYRRRYEILRDSYEEAMRIWPLVASVSGSPLNATHWVDPVLRGLQLYARSEGW